MGKLQLPPPPPPPSNQRPSNERFHVSEPMMQNMIQYNKTMLADYYYELCNHPTQRTNPICRQIHGGENSVAFWESYVENNQFKGIDRERFHFWKFVSNHIQNYYPIESLTSTEYFFITAALLIIWQVFNDGNHRTADKYYKINTNDLNNNLQLLYSQINTLIRSYDYVYIQQLNEPAQKRTISELIHILIQWYNAPPNTSAIANASANIGGRKRSSNMKRMRTKSKSKSKSKKRNSRNKRK
jgi:hypothetical protein